MQFTLDHKVGTNYVTVTLSGKVSPLIWCEFFTKLQYLGGKQAVEGQSDIWLLPTFVTSQVIEEIIHNTCFVCGGLMKDSTAFLNDCVSFDDFGNDAGQRGTTQSRVGEAKQVKVRKCSSCGHSHT